MKKKQPSKPKKQEKVLYISKEEIPERAAGKLIDPVKYNVFK